MGSSGQHSDTATHNTEDTIVGIVVERRVIVV